MAGGLKDNERRIYPPLVRIGQGIAAYFFSSPGRRWPEGSDEGATVEIYGELALTPLPRTSPRRGEETSGKRSLPLTILRVEMSSSTFFPLPVTAKA